MERSNSLGYSYLHEKFHFFLSTLSRRSGERKFTAETLKTSRGLALLLVSILLAWVSVEATQNQATENYRLSHWPKESVWRQILIGRGLTPQLRLGDFSNLLKTHPSPYAEEKKIWVSPDSCVVYLPTSPYHKGPELWTCDQSSLASSWRNLGSGLIGFEKLTDFFENTPKKAKAAPRKHVYQPDPKEFHY